MFLAFFLSFHVCLFIVMFVQLLCRPSHDPCTGHNIVHVEPASGKHGNGYGCALWMYCHVVFGPPKVIIRSPGTNTSDMI